MRFGAAISSFLLHLCVAALVFFGLPSFFEPEFDMTQSIAVEIVTVAEISNPPPPAPAAKSEPVETADIPPPPDPLPEPDPVPPEPEALLSLSPSSWPPTPDWMVMVPELPATPVADRAPAGVVMETAPLSAPAVVEVEAITPPPVREVTPPS